MIKAQNASTDTDLKAEKAVLEGVFGNERRAFLSALSLPGWPFSF